MTEKVDRDGNPLLERGEDEECLATFWHQATPGTTFWRCILPARHLPAQSLPFRKDSVIVGDDDVPYMPQHKGEAAIWQFLGDEMRTTIALGMRDITGVKLLMEVDDNYTRSAPYMKNLERRGAVTPWTESMVDARIRVSSGGSGYSHEANRIVSGMVDGIICSTEYLADIYSDYNDKVYVCPNNVDPADWMFDREPHDTFRIVYYGSPSHTVDTPLVTQALKWASKQPGVEIWTVGFKNPSWSFPYQTIGWQTDLAEARKNLFKFDLGIAPLKRNKWSNSKSDVKVLEYAMAGVCPIFSRAEPFSPWFSVAPDLVVDDAQWEEVIRWAVKNQDDVRTRAEDVRDYVLEERTIQGNVHLWREAING